MTQRRFDRKPTHDDVSHLRPFPADLRSTDERVEALAQAERDGAPPGIEDRVFRASVRRLPRRAPSMRILPRLLPLAAAVGLVGVGVWLALPALRTAPTGGVAVLGAPTPESIEADFEAWLAAGETHEAVDALREDLLAYDADLEGALAEDLWSELTEEM